MIDLAKPGTYVVKADSAREFAHTLIQDWLESQGGSKFKGCLWLTTRSQHEVREIIQPHLGKPHPFLKGLDVVSSRAMLKQGDNKATVRQLCRALESLTVLKPVLIVLEEPNIWFNNADDSIDQRNALSHMRILNRWANHAKACVVASVENEAPRWAVFADGYADVSQNGAFEYRPWWPTTWGIQTDLWNTGEDLQALTTHHLVQTQHCESLKDVARICHHLRFGTQSQAGIHVQADKDLSMQDASVLLRLGADSVSLDPDSTQSPTRNMAPEHIQTFTPGHSLAFDMDSKFGQDLHEVFMPGMLTILNNQVFSREGLMLLTLAEHWQMHLSLTRLSLLPHMSAQTALRLCNWTEGTCVFTATREAVYAMKLWVQPPTDKAYDEWLGNCFRENIHVLFSGEIQFTGQAQQAALFQDLHNEMEPIQVNELPENEINAPDALTDVWVENPLIRDPARPWMQRFHGLIKETTDG